MDPIQVSLDSHTNGVVATITIQNPNKLNSLSEALLDAFVSALRSLHQKPDLRCVILTGGPCAGTQKAFIGGADISELKDIRSPSAARTFITKIHLVCKTLRDLPVPVIAKINGHALGGGLLIMASTDLRVADSKALFGMPEVRRGVPSTIDSALLPSQIGALRARRLVLLGDTISALQAESWGLVDRVVDTSELDDAVEEWVQMLMRAGPKSLTAQKRLLVGWEPVSLSQAIEAGVWEFGKAFEDIDGESEGRRIMNDFANENRRRKAKL